MHWTQAGKRWPVPGVAPLRRRFAPFALDAEPSRERDIYAVGWTSGDLYGYGSADAPSHLDPKIGTWIQNDPAGTWADASAFGNGHSYAGANPVTYVDRTGRSRYRIASLIK